MSAGNLWVLAAVIVCVAAGDVPIIRPPCTKLLIPNDTVTELQEKCFGAALQFTDDYLIVGSCSEAIHVFSNAGTVYLFPLDDLSSPITVRPPFPASNAAFGDVIAATNDFLFVKDNSLPNAAVSVFVFTLPDVRHTQTLSPTNQSATSIAASIEACGDLLIIGVPNTRQDAFTLGAAFLFRLDPETQRWKFSQRVRGNAENELFGMKVVIGNDCATFFAARFRDTTRRLTIHVFDLDPALGLFIHTDTLPTNFVDMAALGPALVMSECPDRIALMYQITRESGRWAIAHSVPPPASVIQDSFASALAIGVGPTVYFSAGSTEILRLRGGSWAALKSGMTQPGEQMGVAIAAHGHLVAVSSATNDGHSAVYLFAERADHGLVSRLVLWAIGHKAWAALWLFVGLTVCAAYTAASIVFAGSGTALLWAFSWKGRPTDYDYL
ncbi:hypothetical protein J8273_0102 [Carpediemonas membranifera]|uniref:Uncharacterized protein n=1 Tax=Carpediemonas membranifera TaxID=201153 RepID=A0A8J6AXG1_9EUKA|nr:hypothetical protein J8273_0102 [Carpediemonas membranifera]|eukprot:KAG9394895.1 hypothetical protein J8273_0102 [Carpediemonas membranifera]